MNRTEQMFYTLLTSIEDKLITLIEKDNSEKPKKTIAKRTKVKKKKGQ
jgi:hypothetical protein